MQRKVDLTDPDFEPTGEELQALSRRAFEGVAERYAAALARLEGEIQRSRNEVLKRVEAELAKRR